jgi:hypothetical protein
MSEEPPSGGKTVNAYFDVVLAVYTPLPGTRE